MGDLEARSQQSTSGQKSESKRDRILEFIKENPGAHFSLIKKELHIGNGTTQYHLWVLMKERKLECVAEANITHYYIRGCAKPVYSRREMVLDTIVDGSGKNQKELAKSHGVSAPTFGYHAKKLIAKGAIEKVKGKEVTYRVLNSLLA